MAKLIGKVLHRFVANVTEGNKVKEQEERNTGS
jgi:hypothetical protein